MLLQNAGAQRVMKTTTQQVMSLFAAQSSHPAWLTCTCAALQVERAAFKYVLRSRNSLSDQEIHSSDLPPGLKLDSFQVGSLVVSAAAEEAAHRHRQLPVDHVYNVCTDWHCCTVAAGHLWMQVSAVTALMTAKQAKRTVNSMAAQ